MTSPFEGKCADCKEDKQKCIFDSPNSLQCKRCTQQGYRCSKSEVDPKRRRLSKLKCHYCRSHRCKCMPEDRQWPEKCMRCKQKGFPCSEPTKAPRYSPPTKPPVKETSVSQESDTESLNSLNSLNCMSSSFGPSADPGPLEEDILSRIEQPKPESRILSFIYAAKRPLNLDQLAVLPAINTESCRFEADKALDINSSNAAQLLSTYFGDSIEYSPIEDIVRSVNLQIDDWTAHLEALKVCLAYQLTEEPESASTRRASFDFASDDIAKLLSILGRQFSPIDTGAVYSSSFGSSNSDAVMQRDCSMWEYSARYWVLHLGQLWCMISTSNQASLREDISSVTGLLERFLTSRNFLSWLQTLKFLLESDNTPFLRSDNPMTTVQAQVLSISSRWIKTAALTASQGDLERLVKIMHWVDAMQSSNFIEYFRPASDNVFRNDWVAETLESWEGHLNRIHQISPSFEFTSYMLQLFSHRLDADYHNNIVGGIAARQDQHSSVLDFSSKVIWYVDREMWSATALQLVCVDMTTGLKLGASHWVTVFQGFKHKTLIAKCGNYIALQLVVLKSFAPGSKIVPAVTTYVWRVKSMAEWGLGEELFDEFWPIDEDKVLPQVVASSEEALLLNSSLLQFQGPNVLYTPTGRWNLETKTKESQQFMLPTSDVFQHPSSSIAVSANSRWQAVVEAVPGFHCRYLMLLETTSQQKVVLFPTLSRHQALAADVFWCRFAGFSDNGHIFSAQIEYVEDHHHSKQSQRKWFFWNLEAGIDHVHCQEVDTAPNSILPRLDGLEVGGNGEILFEGLWRVRDLGPIASVD